MSEAYLSKALAFLNEGLRREVERLKAELATVNIIRLDAETRLANKAWGLDQRVRGLLQEAIDGEYWLNPWTEGKAELAKAILTIMDE